MCWLPETNIRATRRDEVLDRDRVGERGPAANLAPRRGPYARMLSVQRAAAAPADEASGSGEAAGVANANPGPSAEVNG